MCLPSLICVCYVDEVLFLHRLQTLPAGTSAKSVHTELDNLHHKSLKTWVSRIEDIWDSLGVTMGSTVSEFAGDQ